MASNTLFMSPAESARIRTTTHDRIKQREEQRGQPREVQDAKALAEQAVSTSLMQDLSSAAFGFSVPNKSKDTMPAYEIGSPYLPCTKKLEDLTPMKLLDLRMETHHRGSFLLVRRVSPVAISATSSWVAVQDKSQEAERLEMFLHKSQQGYDILDMASDLIVKEPYYTLNNNGESTIRVDHPSDLIVTELSEHPESWRQAHDNTSSHSPPSAKEYKEKGNHALLRKKNHAQALFYYTKGLELLNHVQSDSTLRNDLYRNRSHVNLQLQRFDEAKSDALSSITQNPKSDLDAKAYNRAGLAAYGQGQFLAARKYFEEQERLHPNNQHVKLHLKRVHVRLREATEGLYNMSRIVSSLTKAGGRPDAASFDGPTEIKASPGAGRGLFVMRDIQPNEIIMCEKAFCVAWSHEPETFSALVCDIREGTAIKVFPAGLHKAVVQKLLNNPSQVDRVLDLHGDYEGLGKKLRKVDGVPVIDTFQIHDIIQRNAFGPGQQTEDEDISNASTGLWVRASYINHSCIPNAKKDFIGDLILFRAMSKIAAGEEITHAYDETSDYEARKAAIKRTWNFECRCRLCLVEEMESDDVRRKRREAEEKARDFVEGNNPAGASRMMIRKAKMLRETLNETYDGKKYKGLPRRSLGGIDEWLRLSIAG
ncbi:n-lysine methyltransferase smyd2 [Fusarium flagelliforme]|uniref:N-lysine methyltransferase smyd2 n=1 Tax=Fusarium flagelliforme TaxID=2675880 RepID=A0A395N4R1_9HYPO|nr:n-lysine methyltransferase smyd2 [Fusarium flagelliforme]